MPYLTGVAAISFKQTPIMEHPVNIASAGQRSEGKAHHGEPYHSQAGKDEILDSEL